MRKHYDKFRNRVRPEPSHPTQNTKNMLKLMFYAMLCFGGTVGINMGIIEYLDNTYLAYGVSLVYFVGSFLLFEKKTEEVNNPHECDYCYIEAGRESMSKSIMKLDDSFYTVYLCSDCVEKNEGQNALYRRDDLKFKPLTWSFTSKRESE